jgi:hypothetical protein
MPSSLSQLNTNATTHSDVQETAVPDQSQIAVARDSATPLPHPPLPHDHTQAQTEGGPAANLSIAQHARDATQATPETLGGYCN